MKRNELSLPMMPPKWEPIAKPRAKLRIVKEVNTAEFRRALIDHVLMDSTSLQHQDKRGHWALHMVVGWGL